MAVLLIEALDVHFKTGFIVRRCLTITHVAEWLADRGKLMGRLDMTESSSVRRCPG
ncbi:MAG: hypothetical protein K9K30_09095 [Burkholderiaceae bacterium]|nr:hypothetical protein [Sulfuritalea sp.]MCF8175380.1 hypothetical protein [Burkholderiaceae bacterium]